MIVRETSTGWQVVAQPDHGDVCGALARAWGNAQVAASPRQAAIAITARRHDDGWALWERTPNVDQRDGRPLNVFDIGIEVHLAFFRAMIVAVAEEDAYAGLLASLHAVGIYNQRYGTDPALTMSRAAADQGLVDAFVEEREREHGRLREELGLAPEDVHADYLILQAFDRLCLYLCLNDLEAGAEATLSPVPVDVAGRQAALALTPVAPWAVAIDPYPFGPDPLVVELPRRLMAKRRYESRAAFAAAHAATPIERVPITLRSR